MDTNTLDKSPRGSSVRVVAVSGGRMARQKLTDLGIIPGEKLKIIRNDGSGPVLIGLYDSKVAVGFGLAQKVRVVPAGSE
jgi:ferrous iron transport protein A